MGPPPPLLYSIVIIFSDLHPLNGVLPWSSALIVSLTTLPVELSPTFIERKTAAEVRSGQPPTKTQVQKHHGMAHVARMLPGYKS